MMTLSRVLVVVSALIACSYACDRATAAASVYSSHQSGVVAAVPFIAVVTLKCEGGGAPGPVYARVGTTTLPALRIPGDKYQVSWTEEIGEAVSGDREIHLYNEVGYTALRKAMRSDQDILSIPSLATVTVPYSTGYTGPMINSEIVAAVLSLVVAYIALTNKSRLCS